MKDGFHSPSTRILSITAWNTWAAITLTSLILVAITITGYLLISSRGSPAPRHQTTTGTSNEAAPTGQSTPGQVVAAVATPLKTYQLQSFAVGYPTGWFTSKDLHDQIAADAIEFTNENVKLPSLISSKGAFVSIGNIGNQPTDVAALVFKSPVGAIATKMPGLDHLVKQADLTIGGYPAVYYTMDFSQDSTNPANYFIFDTINKNGAYYNVSASLNKSQVDTLAPIIQKIATSIVFTN